MLFPVSEIKPPGEFKTEASEISEMTQPPWGNLRRFTLKTLIRFLIKKNNNAFFFSVTLQHNITETAKYDEL